MISIGLLIHAERNSRSALRIINELSRCNRCLVALRYLTYSQWAVCRLAAVKEVQIQSKHSSNLPYSILLVRQLSDQSNHGQPFTGLLNHQSEFLFASGLRYCSSSSKTPPPNPIASSKEASDKTGKISTPPDSVSSESAAKSVGSALSSAQTSSESFHVDSLSKNLDSDLLAAAAAAVDATYGSKVQKEPSSKVIVKVLPTAKKREKTDFSQSYTANIYIPATRAMYEYMLESSELDSLPTYTRRSPYPEHDNITVFKRRDVEQRAMDKWGSLENLQLRKNMRKSLEMEEIAKEYQLRYAQLEYKRQHADSKVEKPYIVSPVKDKTETAQQSIFQHGPGRVVLYAVAVNAANCVMKLLAWLYTGSNSMFSEFIHSLADTANQLILAAGLRQSLKKPDLEHPYGWATFRNISSLISGVGIFCVGAGLSYYHGILGLLHGNEVESLGWALAILGGSFLSEGSTLLVAINEIRNSARTQKMSFLEYVYQSADPSTNVVLLEDLAAVGGLGIAASCISLTHYTGNPLYDAVGSLLIGTVLSGVASFIIYTNTKVLIGKSIPREKKIELMRELESDRMIRTIHDVKATDVGGKYIKFKAEVDFDGREVTRYYLEQQDLDKMFQEIQSVSSPEEMEAFMLRHGENLIDSLGGEVDRIENNLKKKHPEIRHCDLEQL